MITDDELRAAMRNLETDSPAEADVAATVRARINRDHKIRSTALASLAAVAAVAAIVTTASFLRSPAQPSQIQPASPPQSQTNSAPASESSPPLVQPSMTPTTTPVAPPPGTTTTVPGWTATADSNPAAICYSAPSLDDPNQFPVAFGFKDGETNNVSLDDFLTACRASMTNRGYIQQGEAVSICALQDGSVGVFPGEPTVCATLGLPVAVAS